MSQRPLDSDELGRKGEILFEGICTDAQLIPNPVKVDRKGWDAIVEWRQPDEAEDYDSRAPTIAARIQVKTVWEGGKSIRLRLSSAEALAKDHHPSLIYVPIVNKHLKHVATRIIHVRGAFLRDILLRLRRARVEGKRPNRVMFAVQLDGKADEIEPSHTAFKRYVEDAVGGSMFDYAVAKEGELGAERGAMRFETKLAIETDDPFDEAAEFFLGRREAKVLDLAAFSTRFGIEIPDKEVSGQLGTMRLLPEPSTKCVVSLRQSTGQVIRFDGDLYRTPRIQTSPQRGRIVARTPAFDMTLDCVWDAASGAVSTDFTLDEGPDADARLPADAWVDVCLLYAKVGEDGATLEIKAADAPQPLVSTSIEMNNENAAVRRNWRALARVSQEAATILRYAGLHNWDLPLAALREEHRKITVLHTMITNPTGLTRLSYELENGATVSRWPEFLLYFDRIEFGEHALAYAALSRFSPEGSGPVFHASFDSIYRIEGIDGSDERFFEFVDTARKLANIDSYYISPRTIRDPELAHGVET